MIKIIKASKSEKIILIFLILLGISTFCTYFVIKNECLLVKNYNPESIDFKKPNNIAILNVPCGNVIIELYPDVSPNGVRRFVHLIRSNAYENIATSGIVMIMTIHISNAGVVFFVTAKIGSVPNI